MNRLIIYRISELARQRKIITQRKNNNYNLKQMKKATPNRKELLEISFLTNKMKEKYLGFFESRILFFKIFRNKSLGNNIYSSLLGQIRLIRIIRLAIILYLIQLNPTYF